MDGTDQRAAEFEQHRAHLRSVAYRMLGSLSDAEDAVQQTWLRMARTDTTEVDNLRGWLTTVAARICVDMLRARASRREEPLDVHVPDPIVTADADNPEHEAVVADSVGLALLVVLDTLSPAERLAFVLHDIFAVPFDEVGPILDRSPAAAKQLASRARRRLRGVQAPDPDHARQRELVSAFLAAARNGDFEALVAVLDPDVVLRADAGTGPFQPSRVVRGASAVAAEALSFARLARLARPVRVNGAAGLLVAQDGHPIAVMGMTVRGGRIAEIYILADPKRLRRVVSRSPGLLEG